MNRFIKYIASVAGVAILLGAVASLNIAVQKNNDTASTELNNQKTTRLDVAIVNEDRLALVGNTGYNLGASYIKNIERDDSQSWSVVSRATADNGLKSGKYQLMVIIPNDFSSKILDLNSLAADRTTISYKVNANGNQQIETEANKVGKDIVSDLNNQLVDMYMASILSNLYTAQQNVQSLTNQETTNISSYQTNLLGSAKGFENNFPSLVTTTKSSLIANDNLTKSLSEFSTTYKDMATSQEKLGTDLNALIEKRSQDAISYEDFAKALMSMDESLLKVELTSLTEQLQASQKGLSEAIDSIGTTSSDDGATSEAINKMGDQIDRLSQTVTNSGDKAKIEEFAKEEVKTYFGKDSVSIADLLGTKKADSEETYLGTSVADYKKSMDDVIQNAINKLPAIDQNGITRLTANMTELDSSVAAVTNFNVDLAKRYDNADYNNTKSDLENRLNTAKTEMETAETNLNNKISSDLTTAATSLNSPEKLSVKISGVSVDAATSDVTANLALEVPEDVSLKEWSYNGTTYTDAQAQNVILKDSNSQDATVTITYQTKDDSTKSTIVLPSNEIKDYRDKVATYAATVQEVKDVYSNAQDLLNAYYKDGKNITDSFFDQPVTDLIERFLVDGINDNLAKPTADLKQEIEDLKTQREGLETKLAAIKEQNEELSEQIAKKIEEVKAVQDQVTAVQDKEKTSSAATKESDSKMSDLNSNLNKLLSSTAELKSTSDTNANEAGQVKDLFTSFNQDMETAQKNSTKLSADADDLMAEFKKELAASDDFSTAFSKVLSNAYKDGVANDEVLKFLSNPVTESSSSVKATINTYRPFTWILLLEVVSIFTAYLFTTYNLVKKAKDKFKVIDRLHDTDLINVAIISVLAIITGVVIGAVSASKLAVEKDLMPSWVLVVTLFSLILMQGHYFFFKNLKALGMGLCLFMTISFVYLSNAIGTTATLKGLPAFLKKINVLSILETALSSYFDSRAASLSLLVLAVIVVLALIFVNIFFTLNLNNWTKGSTEVEA